MLVFLLQASNEMDSTFSGHDRILSSSNVSSLTGSMSNLNDKLLTSRNLNGLTDLLNGAESGGSSNSFTNEKIYSIDHMIKSLNSKLNGKQDSNALHGCPNALADFYNGNGYTGQYSSARSSSSSNGSTSNSTTGSLTPCTSENQSMLSSLLEGCHSSSQMNGLQPNKMNSATSKLFLLNAHNLLASGKSDGAELAAATNASAFTNSTNSNLNLMHSLPYSLMKREQESNSLINSFDSFKPLNYSSLSNLSNLNNLNNLNNLTLSQFSQLQANSELFARHSELLSNYGSMMTHF